MNLISHCDRFLFQSLSHNYSFYSIAINNNPRLDLFFKSVIVGVNFFLIVQQCAYPVLPLKYVHADEIKWRQLCPEHKQRHRSSCGYWPLQLDTQPHCSLLANRRWADITFRTVKKKENCVHNVFRDKEG